MILGALAGADGNDRGWQIPLSLATVLSPVPGTQQNLTSASPALDTADSLDSCILETSRLSSHPMTRQTPSLCLPCVFRCYSVYPETCTQRQEKRQTHVRNESKYNPQKVYTWWQPCSPAGEGLWGGGRDEVSPGESGRSPDRGRQQTQYSLLLMENRKKGKCYFRSSCRDRLLN